MAIIQPFKGWLPKPEKVSDVACPPYDVISTKEAREMAEKKPKSFLHVVDQRSICLKGLFITMMPLSKRSVKSEKSAPFRDYMSKTINRLSTSISLNRSRTLKPVFLHVRRFRIITTM